MAAEPSSSIDQQQSLFKFWGRSRGLFQASPSQLPCAELLSWPIVGF